MADIIKMMTGLADLVYFSARKLSSSRGGGICTNRKDLYGKMEALIPLFEGFLTLRRYFGARDRGDGRRFARDARRDDDQPESVVYQIPSRIARQARYSGSDPSGRVGSPRGCDGFLSAHSADRIPRRRAGSRVLPDFGYPRNGTGGPYRASGTRTATRSWPTWNCCVWPCSRRVFTLSQVKYVIDRLAWLYENRDMIGGLKFVYEPPVLRFFMGGLEPTSDWPEN